MKYGNRSLWKRFIASPFTLVAIAIFFFVLARATWSIHAKSRLSEQRLSQAQVEFAKLQARQADLTTKVDYLSTDQGVEAEIRSKYRAVKDGESVAVIVDGQVATSGTAAAVLAPVNITIKTSWWVRFWRAIGF